MIVQTNKANDWPDTKAYVRWQQRQMDQSEQRKFFGRLYGFALRVGGRRFGRQFSNEDIEELAVDAVTAHADTFLDGKGTARSHLVRIFRNKALSALRRVPRQREALGEDISDTWIDTTPDTTSDVRLKVECKEQEELFTHIWTNWDELPNYPWKDTVRMYLEWTLTSDWSDESRIQREFVDHCLRNNGLNKGESTIYRHIAVGTKQLIEWLQAGVSPLCANDPSTTTMKYGTQGISK